MTQRREKKAPLAQLVISKRVHKGINQWSPPPGSQVTGQLLFLLNQGGWSSNLPPKPPRSCNFPPSYLPLPWLHSPLPTLRDAAVGYAQETLLARSTIAVFQVSGASLCASPKEHQRSSGHAGLVFVMLRLDSLPTFPRTS